MSILFLFFLLLATTTFIFLKKINICKYILLFTCFYTLTIASGLLPSLLAYSLQKPFIHSPTLNWKQNNVIILLGGGTTLLPNLPTVIPHTMSFARLNKAAALYVDCKKHSVATCKILIASGVDKTTHTIEAENYRFNLIQLGISLNDLIVETRSENTRQNALYSEKILQSQAVPFDQVILVTSGIHLKRSLLWFEHYGIHAIPALADYQTYGRHISGLGYNFALTDAALHEYLGIIQLYTGLYATN